MSFARLVEESVRRHLPSVHPRGARMTGHIGGDYVEEKCLDFLAGLGALRTHVFLDKYVREVWAKGRFSSVEALMAHLDSLWWWRLNSRTLPLVRACVMGGIPLAYKQQDTADLVVVHNGIVHLINVKSHDTRRDSRAPNIISLSKVLDFFDWMMGLPEPARTQALAEAEVYFLSVSWRETAEAVELLAAHVRRLTRLDVARIPQLNYDAGLQIQWHVESMVEVEQTPVEFARRLAARNLEDFSRHAKRKADKFRRLSERFGS